MHNHTRTAGKDAGSEEEKGKFMNGELKKEEEP